MSIEMKKNSQIFQDSNNTYYPEDELQISNIVQELYKKNQPTEIIGTGSKNFIGNRIQSAKKISLSKISGIIEYLPEEFQTAEYVKDHGGIDLVVERQYLNSTIGTLLNVLLKKAESQAKQETNVTVDKSLQAAS